VTNPQPPSTEHAETVRFADWSRRLAPGLDAITNSNPNAILAPQNLVAVTSETEQARDVARTFERMTPQESAVTAVVYGHADRRDEERTVDPERVTAHAGRRALVGAAPGAVIGALVVGLGAWLITSSAAGAVAAAIGGALFGAAVAAVWSFVIGTGQSEAYRETFVDPETADLSVIALHADDPEQVDRAASALSGSRVAEVRLLRVDARGQTADEHDQPTRRSRPSQ
jgi:uncharacterized membrane protein